MKRYISASCAAALGLAALTALLPQPIHAQTFELSDLMGDSGAPPVIAREPMILQVLPETGSCGIHPMAPPIPCPRVRLPDGSVRDVQIDGFHRGGPMTIEVDRLTYDWAQQTASHPYTPAFAYTGETEHAAWTPEQWGPCDNNACARPEPTPLHPVYSIPQPQEVARDFIEVELLSDQGRCTLYVMPEEQEFPCHEVRLPDGTVISLDIGVHARFAVGDMLYFQRSIHADAHPLFDHDRYNFYPTRRPGG